LHVRNKKNPPPLAPSHNLKVEKFTLQEKRSYLKKHLRSIANEIAIAAKSSEVRRYIENQAKLQFDGDYNVLIKDILFVPSISKKANINKINSALAMFQQIEGNNYYPQIYIPRLSAPKQSAQYEILSTDIDSNEDPLFVIYDGDETALTFEAYELDENDSLISTGNFIDENYAISNEVYVFSLSESVNDDGIFLDSAIDPFRLPPPPTNDNSMNVQINKMTVLDPKESWAAGKSDVHIKAYRYTWNGYWNGGSSPPVREYISDKTEYGSGSHLIKKFSKSDVKDKKEFTLNYSIQERWQFKYNDPVIYYFVILERDAWPSPIRTAAAPLFWAHSTIAMNDRAHQFRSANSEYWIESFYASFRNIPASTVVPEYLINSNNIYTNNDFREIRRRENSTYSGIRFNLNTF
jgi:hypothetical protein